MGLFRGAVFRHGGAPEISPLALMGRFPTWENSPFRKGIKRFLDEKIKVALYNAPRLNKDCPPAQNQYMQGLYSHWRYYRRIFWRHHFLRISQILEGIHFGANTCHACIANTGNNSWRFIYVLVSRHGVTLWVRRR